ncbi:MAG: RDD family protein [Lysinibacillus sp.]
MTNNEIVMQGSPSVEASYAQSTSQMMQVEKRFTLKTAGFWVRFWAFLLDTLIVSAIIGICVNPIFYIMDWSLSESVWYAPISIISAILYYAYFVLFTKLKGQTLGKMVFGIQVVSLNHDKLSWSDVLFREWVGRFISNVFALLYVLVAILPKNQGLHDYFADTTVVHEEVFEETEVMHKQEIVEQEKTTTENDEEPTEETAQLVSEFLTKSETVQEDTVTSDDIAPKQ